FWFAPHRPSTSVAAPPAEVAAPVAPPIETPAPAAAAVAPRARGERPASAPAAAPAAPAGVEVVPDAGSLRIETDVPNAQVFLDRQFIGTAPVTAANVKPGPHQLNVSAEGF